MGLVAIAAGDREEARRQSKRAAQLVPNQPLATLLAAQTAQLEGDEQAAHSYFTKLAETPDTAFLGLRGLWMQAMKDGRTREALHFVDQAHAEQPNAAWVLEAQLTLQARLGQWDAANQSLETLAKRKLRTPEQAKEARALINVERSRTAAAAGDTIAGLDAALVAYKANPALVPAVAQLALMQIANNRRGRAEKVLKDAWRSTPHPMLVDSFRGVVDTVSPEKQLDLARGLAGLNPNAADSHILVARFAIAADRWNDAEGRSGPVDPPRSIGSRLSSDGADRGLRAATIVRQHGIGWPEQHPPHRMRPGFASKPALCSRIGRRCARPASCSARWTGAFPTMWSSTHRGCWRPLHRLAVQL